MVPGDSYVMPIVYAVVSIVLALTGCLVCCHLHVRRSARSHGVPSIDEIPSSRQIIDSRRHCYHHHDLLHHHDHSHQLPDHEFGQTEQPSPSSESDEGDVEEADLGCDQETSSPDSMWRCRLSHTLQRRPITYTLLRKQRNPRRMMMSVQPVKRALCLCCKIFTCARWDTCRVLKKSSLWKKQTRREFVFFF